MRKFHFSAPLFFGGITLKLLPGTDVTPELNAELSSNVSQAERESAEKIRKRRPQLNFSEMGIPDGATLTFKDGSVSVQVAGPRKVDMDGEITSLTEATRRTLGIDYSVAPAPHWTYGGKLLRDYYNETYS